METTRKELALRFEVIGTPQQRGSKIPVGKKGGGIHLVNGRPILKDSNAKSRAWMDAVAFAAHEAWGRQLLNEPLTIGCEFYFRRPKVHYRTGRNAHLLSDNAPVHHAKSPDIAKLMRCLEDALTGVVWTDDKLVVGYTEPTQRYWTTEAEKAVVRIYTFADPAA